MGDAPVAGDVGHDAGHAARIRVLLHHRAQTLQEVPVAVTVTDARTIERAQILDILDLIACF